LLGVHLVELALTIYFSPEDSISALSGTKKACPRLNAE